MGEKWCFNQMVGEGLSEKVASEQSPKGREGAAQHFQMLADHKLIRDL